MVTLFIDTIGEGPSQSYPLNSEVHALDIFGRGVGLRDRFEDRLSHESLGSFYVNNGNFVHYVNWAPNKSEVPVSVEVTGIPERLLGEDPQTTWSSYNRDLFIIPEGLFEARVLVKYQNGRKLELKVSTF